MSILKYYQELRFLGEQRVLVVVTRRKSSSCLDEIKKSSRLGFQSNNPGLFRSSRTSFLLLLCQTMVWRRSRARSGDDGCKDLADAFLARYFGISAKSAGILLQKSTYLSVPQIVFSCGEMSKRCGEDFEAWKGMRYESAIGIKDAVQ